jgi:hypothetical protein
VYIYIYISIYIWININMYTYTYTWRGAMVTRYVRGQFYVLLAPEARIRSEIHFMEPPGGT